MADIRRNIILVELDIILRREVYGRLYDMDSLRLRIVMNEWLVF